VLKSTTKVQPTLLLSQRRAKKIIWGRGKNGLAKKMKMDCFPIENVPKTARGRAPKKKFPLFRRKKRAHSARRKIGECRKYSGTLISTLLRITDVFCRERRGPSVAGSRLSWAAAGLRIARHGWWRLARSMRWRGGWHGGSEKHACCSMPLLVLCYSIVQY
jgi:hypothetical protein